MTGILEEIKRIQQSEFKVPKAEIAILILLQLFGSAAALGRIEALKEIVNLIGERKERDTVILYAAMLVVVTLFQAAVGFLLAGYLERCRNRALGRYVRRMMERNLSMESWKDAHTNAPDRYVLMTRELEGFVDSIYRSIPDLIAWMAVVWLFGIYLGTVSILALAVAVAVQLAVWRLSGRIQAQLPELNRDRRGKYGKWMNYLNRTFENYDVMRTSVSPKRYGEIFDKKAYRWNASSIQGLERLLTLDQIQNGGGIAMEAFLLFIGVLGLLTGRYQVGGVYALVASVQAIKKKFAQMPDIAEAVYEAQSHYRMLAEFMLHSGRASGEPRLQSSGRIFSSDCPPVDSDSLQYGEGNESGRASSEVRLQTVSGMLSPDCLAIGSDGLQYGEENGFAGKEDGQADRFEKLELKEVSFGYRNAGEIITGFSHTFHRGNMYAIVGEAGTGKTTVLLLIARMLRETGGSLYYNGVNIRDISRESLWKQMIYVSRPCFIRGTVQENVRFGRESFDAGLYREIAEWDGQLLSRKVEDEEGSGFSAGERQRILIYRALCAGCGLVLLDEPFSNLDQAMERKMIGLMERSAKAGKCILFTTHRSAVLERCAGIISLAECTKNTERQVSE